MPKDGYISKNKRAKVINRRAADGAEDEEPMSPEVKAGVLARGLVHHSLRTGLSSFNVGIGGTTEEPLAGVYVVVHPEHAKEMHKVWLELQDKWGASAGEVVDAVVEDHPDE